jgi:hypothetical protein
MSFPISKRVRMACVRVGLCLASSAMFANGSIIFSNFGPGDSYDPRSYTVQTSVFVAAPFVPIGSNYILDQIDLPLALIGGLNSLTVDLATNAGGVPGAAIESWVFNDLAPFPDSSPPLSASSVSHPELYGGAMYWLVVTATNASTIAAWNLNSIGAETSLAFSYDGGATWIHTEPTVTVTAFDVLGTAIIPEPGYRSVLLLGLVSLGLLRTVLK